LSSSHLRIMRWGKEAPTTGRELCVAVVGDSLASLISQACSGSGYGWI
jgi:hypothetical protein